MSKTEFVMKPQNEAMSAKIENANFKFSTEMLPTKNQSDLHYKYSEDAILRDLKKYLDNTYTEHYKTDEENVECFDVWIALGEATPTFRNTALKYIWRYGKKNGNNKQDLLKALHYIMMCLHVDHYKK